MVIVFWLCFSAVAYAYFGYPLLLLLLPRARANTGADSGASLPSISLIIPVHNEAAVLDAKLANTLALDYPADRLRVIIVSDGSTDDTARRVRAHLGDSRLELVELPRRQGKAAALNQGLERAHGEIVVFSDATIMLQPDALRRIVAPFVDPMIGCVSGEDHIGDGGGEGMYGRYELLLRNLESRVHSIVGASGSFYAQRRALCQPFVEGMAPDFLSVLNTVEQGYRAVSERSARGTMASVRAARDEFQRKVRTLIRGMTALFAKAKLLNPLRYGFFAVALISHKLMRWLVPFCLIGMLVTSMWLGHDPLFFALLVAQVLFYAAALLALVLPSLQAFALIRVALYFTVVNAAILVAWIRFARGVRMEVWAPSRRAS